MSDQDVFVNVVGGVKVGGTGADLALLLALISSFRNRPLPQDLVVFGEVGLAGEIRPVTSGPVSYTHLDVYKRQDHDKSLQKEPHFYSNWYFL